MGCDLGNICAKPVKNVKKDMICGQGPDVLHFSSFSNTLFLSPMPLSHKTTEALTDSSASKTFHE
jgi:hypothetical protein